MNEQLDISTKEPLVSFYLACNITERVTRILHDAKKLKLVSCKPLFTFKQGPAQLRRLSTALAKSRTTELSVEESRQIIWNILDRGLYISVPDPDETPIPHDNFAYAVSKAVQAVNRGQLQSLEDVHKYLYEFVSVPPEGTDYWYTKCLMYTCITDLLPLWNAMTNRPLPIPWEFTNCPDIVLGFIYLYMTEWLHDQRLDLLTRYNKPLLEKLKPRLLPPEQRVNNRFQ